MLHPSAPGPERRTDRRAAWRWHRWNVHPSKTEAGYWREPWRFVGGVPHARPYTSEAYDLYLNITLRYLFQRELGRRAFDWDRS